MDEAEAPAPLSAVCAADGLEIPARMVATCGHCGISFCHRHLKAHAQEVKLTFSTIPRLMGVRK